MHAAMRAFSQGGEFMCVVALVLAAGIAAFTVRFVTLFVRYNINAVAFMSQIQKLVAANNIDRAVKLCNAAPSALLSRVIKAGLVRAEGEALEIRGALEEAVLEVLPLLRQRSRALLGLGVVAACLGVMGTAVGWIRAFSAFDGGGPELDTIGLVDGLTTSMYPLVFGIAVAIVCLVAHFVLSGVATRIANEIKRNSAKLNNMLAARHRSGGCSAPEERDGEAP